jgi:hypothetical protein
MNAYRPTSTRIRVVIAVATFATASALLETVAGSMLFPDATAAAERRQVLASQGERAQALRDLESGEVRVAVTPSATRI